MSKGDHGALIKVRSLSAESLYSKPKTLEHWMKSIQEMHGAKPPAQVHYTRRMPDIESLMQEWPAEIEQALQNVNLWFKQTLNLIGLYIFPYINVLNFPYRLRYRMATST